MTPTTAPPPLLTAEEFGAHYQSIRAELVRGVVVELPMPFAPHGYVCSTAGYFLADFIRKHDLGRVMTNDTWIKTQRGPDTVRGADVCFFSYERLPRGPLSAGLVSVSPELVVEVRSPSDRWPPLFAKASEYLEAGVCVVVLLDPQKEAATVMRPDEFPQVFHNGDTLTLPDVLPGFAVPLAQLFA